MKTYASKKFAGPPGVLDPVLFLFLVSCFSFSCFLFLFLVFCVIISLLVASAREKRAAPGARAAKRGPLGDSLLPVRRSLGDFWPILLDFLGHLKGMEISFFFASSKNLQNQRKIRFGALHGRFLVDF